MIGTPGGRGGSGRGIGHRMKHAAGFWLRLA
jgi:hypothetical protein